MPRGLSLPHHPCVPISVPQVPLRRTEGGRLEESYRRPTAWMRATVSAGSCGAGRGEWQ
jgi:hypothetical protein